MKTHRERERAWKRERRSESEREWKGKPEENRRARKGATHELSLIHI